MAEEYKASKLKEEVEERLHFRLCPLLLLSSIFVSMNCVFHIEHHVSSNTMAVLCIMLAKYMENKSDKDRTPNLTINYIFPVRTVQFNSTGILCLLLLLSSFNVSVSLVAVFVAFIFSFFKTLITSFELTQFKLVCMFVCRILFISFIQHSLHYVSSFKFILYAHWLGFG